MVAGIPQAEIHIPPHSYDFAVQSALMQMRRRGLIRVSGGLIHPERSQLDLLRFYANSIAHLVPVALSAPPESGYSASAKGNSASAGS